MRELLIQPSYLQYCDQRLEPLFQRQRLLCSSKRLRGHWWAYRVSPIRPEYEMKFGITGCSLVLEDLLTEPLCLETLRS